MSTATMSPALFMDKPRARPLPEELGFRSGPGSVHESRTIMLEELGLLLDHLPADAPADRYRLAVVEDNVLGKPTRSTRLKTAKYLASLYALDPSRAVFRLLRHFWASDQTGRPMLAYLAAVARDPLLRECSDVVLDVRQDETLDAAAIALALSERHPGRFRPSTLLATAQRLASSWTQAGYLTGKVDKKRSRPKITPMVTTFALLLGYLAGLRGKMLLDTAWTRMLDRTPAEIVGPRRRGFQAGLAELQGGRLGGRDHLPRPADARTRRRLPMNRIDLLKKNYQRLCEMLLGPQRRRCAAGLARRLRQGRRAEAAAPAGTLRGSHASRRPQMDGHRPDRRVCRTGCAARTTPATPRVISSRPKLSMRPSWPTSSSRSCRGFARSWPALADPDNTVLALYGVASLFGFLKISEILPMVEGDVQGRLLVFFPGVYEQNNYRLLDARDGWNYHAVPITASDVEARS